LTIEGSWLERNLSIYFGNASTKRDFRSQLRGNRAVILWGVYLIVLIGYALLSYRQIGQSYDGMRETMSVAELQRKLHEFYAAILYFLGAVILIVAPGLTATTIVAERQRHSLDLIFSAPVTPKYYLVGKMLSSYRYTWMILILSLPVTSVCVVLGGASWSDVLVTYLLLSMQALILTAMALVVSTFATKPVGAVIASYAMAAVYAGVTAGMAAGSVFRGFGAQQSGEMAFIGQLSPFFLPYTASSYTVIAGHEIPNWIFATITALLFSKILLLGAGSMLNPSGSKETIGLRIHGLAYVFGLALLVGWTLMASASVTDYTRALSAVFTWGLMPLIFAAPTIVCFGRDRERKFWNDGLFSLSGMMRGTPAGGLPYLLSLVSAATAAVILGGYLGGGRLPNGQAGLYFLWALGFWTFIWGLGRWLSASSKMVKSAQGLLAILVVVGLAFPPVFLSWIYPDGPRQPGTIWSFYPMTPVFLDRDRPVSAICWAAVMLVCGTALALAAERRSRRPVRPLSSVTPPPPISA
jgi:hypothetical protein